MSYNASSISNPNRKRKSGFTFSADWIVIVLFVALLFLGWLSVCGATHEFGDTNFLDWSSRSGKQLVWMLCACGLGLCILLIDDKFFDMLAMPAYVGMMLLLLITPFIASNHKGSYSWIDLGAVSLQPAEFAKCITALAVAKVCNQYGFSLEKRSDFLKALAIVVLPMLLIVMQRETGSALVYLALFLMFYREGMPGSILFTAVAAVVYFVVGIRFANDPLPSTLSMIGEVSVLSIIWIFVVGMLRVYCPKDELTWSIGIGGLIAMAAAYAVSAYIIPFDIAWLQVGVIVVLVGYLIWKGLGDRINNYFYIAIFAIGSVVFLYISDYALNHVLDTHQTERINVLLGVDTNVTGAGYNVNQSKIAIGSGGLSGKGFMNGTQTKLKYVPEQDTDFIFCTVGEEQGFFGSTLVLLLFLALILRLIYLSERQTTTFGRVYGYCVLSILLFHVFINIGMVIGLTPVIGIPLPFFSYGGSSLWGFTLLLFIFLLINASDKRRLRS